MASLASGQKIDRFELVAVIGRGGMGEVWEAVDRCTDERVALKLVKEGRASQALSRRFAREIRAATAVDHPAVVKIREVVETEAGDPVMVMELLTGESLAARLEREPELSVDLVAAVMLPVISAVRRAHATGIVHRDLKPENIFLVRGDGDALDVRLLDFGIAKLLADEDEGNESAGLTTTGSVLGTPCYMAPEQVFGEKDLDHRADIWSLGIILYQMLTGILPTRADNVGQVLKIIVTRGIWPLSEAAPDLPGELAMTVERMLAKNRDDRPADLREVEAVLARFAGSPSSQRTVADGDMAALEAVAVATEASVQGYETVDPLSDTILAAPQADEAGQREGEPTGFFGALASRWRLVLGAAVIVALASGWSALVADAPAQAGATARPSATVAGQQGGDGVVTGAAPEPMMASTASPAPAAPSATLPLPAKDAAPPQPKSATPRPVSARPTPWVTPSATASAEPESSADAGEPAKTQPAAPKTGGAATTEPIEVKPW